MLTVGSLFSGIGGLELGLERAGMRVEWQVEQDDFCLRVLADHWPDAQQHRDVRNVGAHNLAPVDVICGGFPCQDISSAGTRAGITGARSGLWSEYARIIGELRPRYVLVENSADLLVRGMDRVLGDLAALRYDAEWEVLPAYAVGAPHRRERAFIVAYPERRRLQGGVLECAQPPADLAAPRRRDRHGRHVGASWGAEPDVALLAHGLPARLVEQYVRALGNAVVPQIAEFVGRLIVADAAARRVA